MRRTRDLAISQLAETNAIRRHAGLYPLLRQQGLWPTSCSPTILAAMSRATLVRGTLQVAGGNEQSAQYYRDIVAPQMKFETTETIENSSIRNLLAYFGYPDINARFRTNSHPISSWHLGADGDILATAFFAPKISRVETPPPVTPSAFGWRKLVRFKAKTGWRTLTAWSCSISCRTSSRNRQPPIR